MADSPSESTRHAAFGYPLARKGPDVPYHNPSKAKNPVLRGYPLAVAAFLCVGTLARDIHHA